MAWKRLGQGSVHAPEAGARKRTEKKPSHSLRSAIQTDQRGIAILALEGSSEAVMRRQSCPSVARTKHDRGHWRFERR
jgi:hypothetical protein